MEKQSLITSPNDNVGKQKKGYTSVQTLFITILLLGLVFYGGEYWGGHRALGDAPTCNPPCDIPPGLDHAVCINSVVRHGSVYIPTCQSGQPDALCEQTSDCFVQTDLDPPHAVCRESQCQSGKSGSSCGVDSDCVKPTGLEHPVCRQGKCQRGVYKDYCGRVSDCSSNNCVGVTDIAKCKK